MGSVEAPPLWRCTMILCLAQLVPLWLESGFGMVLDCVLDKDCELDEVPKVVTHFLWADNVWLLSHNRQTLLKMIQSLGDLLNSKGLFWKPSSLMAMTTRDNEPADMPVMTLRPDGDLVQHNIPMVEEMEVLGTKLHRTGRSSTPLEYRIEKAEKAIRANHEILFNKAVSLKTRFRELVKRIFPVVSHGCGSWAWSDELCQRIKTWETEILSRMLVLVKPKGCKNSWKWWARRMVRGRQLFVEMGFQSVLVRVLKSIYRFSLKMMNPGSRSIDSMAHKCLTWRSAQWWEHRKGRKMGQYLRHVRGRPYVRWEDAFVRWLKTTRWPKLMFENVPRWKAAEDEFVNFCLSWRRVTCAFVGGGDNDKDKVDEKGFKKPPRTELELGPLHEPWHATNGLTNRVELLGDSRLCVEWLNGRWPTRSPFLRAIISELQTKLFKWNSFLNMEPRRKNANWSRHIFRELNDECDGLSKLGVQRNSCGFCLEMVMGMEQLPPYIYGAWDGAYNPGSRFVGVGWTIYGGHSFCPNTPGVPEWKCLARGHGKGFGGSATIAEIFALKCLITTIDRLVRGHNLFDAMDFLDIDEGLVIEKEDVPLTKLPYLNKVFKNYFTTFSDVSDAEDVAEPHAHISDAEAAPEISEQASICSSDSSFSSSAPSPPEQYQLFDSEDLDENEIEELDSGELPLGGAPSAPYVGPIDLDDI